MKRLIPIFANAPGFNSGLLIDKQLALIDDKIFNEGTVVKVAGNDNAVIGKWGYDDDYNIYASEIYVSSSSKNDDFRIAIITHKLDDNGDSIDYFIEYRNIHKLHSVVNILGNVLNVNGKYLHLIAAETFKEAKEQIKQIQEKQTKVASSSEENNGDEEDFVISDLSKNEIKSIFENSLYWYLEDEGPDDIIEPSIDKYGDLDYDIDYDLIIGIAKDGEMVKYDDGYPTEPLDLESIFDMKTIKSMIDNAVYDYVNAHESDLEKIVEEREQDYYESYLEDSMQDEMLRERFGE